MMLTVDTHAIPLQRGSDGAWRVGLSRVLLDLVIHAFNAGCTPEEIIQSYSTLLLEDIYAIIAYYLNNQFEVDAYLHYRQQETDTLWADIEARPDYQSFRQSLLSRSAQLKFEPVYA